jgi:hypothetical protein
VTHVARATPPIRGVTVELHDEPVGLVVCAHHALDLGDLSLGPCSRRSAIPLAGERSLKPSRRWPMDS